MEGGRSWSLLREPRLERRPLHRGDRERHPPVVDAAELGTLPAVGARLLDRYLDHVLAAGVSVALLEEGRDVEAVDDVVRREPEANRLVDRHEDLRSGLAEA